MLHFVTREALVNINTRILGDKLRHKEPHYAAIAPDGRLWVVPKKSSRVPPYALAAAEAAISEYKLRIEGETSLIQLTQLKHVEFAGASTMAPPARAELVKLGFIVVGHKLTPVAPHYIGIDAEGVAWVVHAEDTDATPYSLGDAGTAISKYVLRKQFQHPLISYGDLRELGAPVPTGSQAPLSTAIRPMAEALAQSSLI